jgi:uncharacterized protein (TIGR03083 family)
VKISPRYDADPIVRLDGAPSAVGVPFLRQQSRLAQVLPTLTPEQWAVPSRCEGWRVQDVVAHLAGTDRFWTVSIASGLSGTPSRFLTDFDPKANPAALVDAVRAATVTDTLTSYVESSTALCAAVDDLDDAGWNVLAETPIGHVTVSTLVHHALWDAWIHERDILQPLGLVQPEEPDEILAALRYAAALAPAFAVQSSTGQHGSLVLDVTQPEARVVVTVDDVVSVTDGDGPDDAFLLTGTAVDLLEALSVRLPWRQPIPDEKAWLVTELAAVFESAPTG